MKMKRSPSFSSSSSSSCIESPSSPPPHQLAVNKPKSRAKRNCSTSTSSTTKIKGKGSRTKKIVDLQNDSTQIQINPPPTPTTPSSGNGRRSSCFRGVTRHRWTGRFEAHLWDKTTWNSIQNKKGRQIYLGAYDNEEAAARTYDLAAIKYWGPTTILNFPIERYAKEIEEMERMSKDEFMASLRRKSSGFSRGVSKFRGVARHHHNGRWEARIGRVYGSKYLYLGTYGTQEEAAVAYDKAAIEYRGPGAITNFDISDYPDKLREYHERMEQQNNPIPTSSSFTDVTQSLAQTEHVQEHVREYVQEHVREPQQIQNTEAIEAQQVMDEIEITYERELQPPLTWLMPPYDEIDLNLHPWNMYLDYTAFNYARLPIDIPVEEPVELPDPLADSISVNEIDFLFDFAVIENKDCVSSGSTLSGVQEEDTPRNEGGETAESSPSPSSSASVCTDA